MKIRLVICLLCITTWSYGQNVQVICNIPSSLNENSGMLAAYPSGIWLHNDSGDSAKLYKMDTTGTVIRTLLVQQATNIDWEDMTQDAQGNVYIGDFGNNGNNRQNLRIYRIPHPDSVVGNATTAEEIRFYYPEQTAFPAPDHDKNYDLEAMIFLNDSLYLFTKDRTNPHQGYTRLYQVPADTGYHAAVLLDSFYTGQASVIFEITAAALSPNKQQLALLNANTVLLFSNFSGHHFFDGIAQAINLGSINQKEAIDFKDNNELYFSNEQSFLGGPKLYHLDLAPILHTSANPNQLQALKVFPVPSQQAVNVQFTLTKEEKIKIDLYDNMGKRIQKLSRETLTAQEHTLTFDFPTLAAGVYYLRIKAAKQELTKRIIISP